MPGNSGRTNTVQRPTRNRWCWRRSCFGCNRRIRTVPNSPAVVAAQVNVAIEMPSSHPWIAKHCRRHHYFNVLRDGAGKTALDFTAGETGQYISQSKCLVRIPEPCSFNRRRHRWKVLRDGVARTERRAVNHRYSASAARVRRNETWRHEREFPRARSFRDRDRQKQTAAGPRTQAAAILDKHTRTDTNLPKNSSRDWALLQAGHATSSYIFHPLRDVPATDASNVSPATITTGTSMPLLQ